jgi:hypothetical protein
MSPFENLWREIAARPSGPFAFRFYIQPLMALIFATRDGIRDAKVGAPAFFWAMFTKHGNERRQLVGSGWHSIRRVFFFAIAMDVIYELVVLRGLRPLQGLITAVVLAIVPYTFARGPVNRIARRILRYRNRAAV